MTIRARIVDACLYCATRERLKRTFLTAIIVGTVLTLLNQIDIVISGNATTTTYLKCAGNYVVPFIVSNVGMLIGRGSESPAQEPAPAPAQARAAGSANGAGEPAEEPVA